MNFNEYQNKARVTALYPGVGDNFVYPVLGLVDEVGEVAGKVKKLIRDNNKHKPSELTAEERAALMKEVGDVLWYIANLASELGYDLETVAQTNLDKLASRMERGVLGGSGDNR